MNKNKQSIEDNAMKCVMNNTPLRKAINKLTEKDIEVYYVVFKDGNEIIIPFKNEETFNIIHGIEKELIAQNVDFSVEFTDPCYMAEYWQNGNCKDDDRVLRLWVLPQVTD